MFFPRNLPIIAVQNDTAIGTVIAVGEGIEPASLLPVGV
jgi:hypothetical protein